ncbi:hypothetical protein Tco_1337418 [Tanacetum coccineum]
MTTLADKAILSGADNHPPMLEKDGGESRQLATPGRRMSRELGYGIRDTWDDLVGAIQEIAPTTLEGVNQRVIELSTTVDQEDEIIYSHLDDARYDRALLRARVNRLDSDRPFHRRTALLIEEEARLSRAAWARSMDACDQVHSEGISLRTTVMAQQSEITELQAADRRRQAAEAVSRDPKDSEEPQGSDDRDAEKAGNCYGSAEQRLPEEAENGTRGRLHRPEAHGHHSDSPPVTAYTTTSVTGAQLQAMIDEGVTAVLAARATTRNGDDSHTSGTGVQRSGQIDPVVERMETVFSHKMFPEETDKIERYVGGMPDPIYSSVVGSKANRPCRAVEMATELMD